MKTQPMEQLDGAAYGGPCDGLKFKHTADMKRVKLNGCEKPKPRQHIYVFHEGLTAERGVRTYLWEKMEGWKV